MEVDISKIVDSSAAEWNFLSRDSLGICHDGYSLLVLFEFSGHGVNLGTQQSILIVDGIGSLLKFLDLGFKVFEVLLLPLSECTLSGSILGLAFLYKVLVIL